MGCLTDFEGRSDTGFGGNIDTPFLAPATTFQLVAWPDGCDGTVGFGPVNVDMSGGRVLILPYGKTIGTLTMLALAIPHVPGG